MSGDYSGFSFKKQAETCCVTEIMWFGQVCLNFRLVILCLFLKEGVKLDKFHCLPFLFNPSFTEQQNFLLLWNWAHILPIFLELFSRLFFQGFINRLNCSQNLLLFRFLIFHGII